jgi:hypothetical protein
VVQFPARHISTTAFVLASAGLWELRKAPRHRISDVLHPSVAIVLIVNALDTHFETTPTSLSLTGTVRRPWEEVPFPPYMSRQKPLVSPG